MAPYFLPLGQTFMVDLPVRLLLVLIQSTPTAIVAPMRIQGTMVPAEQVYFCLISAQLCGGK